MLTTRRALLGVTALAVPAALLAGCANTPTVTQQVVDDVNLVANALKAELPNFTNVSGVDTTKALQITSWVQSIVAAAGSVVAGVATNIALPVVQQIDADFKALQSALGGLALPAAVTNVLNAVASLLPVIEIAVGIVLNAAAKAPAMSPNKARATLHAVAG